MTHDELLALLDEFKYWDDWKFYPALRAVVELHKPVEQTTGASYTQENGLEVMETETRCFHCTFGTGIFYYPCPTIKAIEKELV